MAVTKLTCPKCETVLKPAKPLPEGKKVKCPKCATVFGAAEAADAAARTPQPAAAKKGPPKGPALPRPGDEEEESKGIYGFEKSDEPEEEEDEDGKPKKPQINYAPDMSIKDLRGPAQAAVMKPSNALIFVGIMGFLGWLGLIVVLLIPVLFPLPDENEGKPRPAKSLGPALAAGAQAPAPASPFGAGAAGPKSDDKKKEEDTKSAFDVAGIDFGLLSAFVWWMLILAILPLVLGMVYCSFLTYGGVKMQNLESWGWSLAGSIIGLLNAWTLIGTAMAIWCIIVLNDPKVKEGFRYQAEHKDDI